MLAVGSDGSKNTNNGTSSVLVRQWRRQRRYKWGAWSAVSYYDLDRLVNVLYFFSTILQIQNWIATQFCVNYA